MTGPGQAAQGALSYEFSIEHHVSPDHLLRGIDRFADLGEMPARHGLERRNRMIRDIDPWFRMLPSQPSFWTFDARAKLRLRHRQRLRETTAALSAHQPSPARLDRVPDQLCGI